jgi:ankyrin repeat protein
MSQRLHDTSIRITAFFCIEPSAGFSSDGMIELVLDAYPEGISESDRKGFLPLHLACECRRPFQTLDLLLSQYPGAASVSPERWNGFFQLHRCLQLANMNSSDTFTLTLIEAYPEAVSCNNTGMMALHLACERGLSLAIMHRLYHLYPGAVMVEDVVGRIPLHLACQSALEVVKFLVENYPDGVQSIAQSGLLPLHYALQRRVAAPLEVIQVLIEAYPDAVNVTDTDGKLPLHTACTYGPTLEIIQLLLDRFVGDEQHHNGLSIADNRGQLPIHWYARSPNVRVEAARYLLELYPGGIHAADTVGCLPLHYACDSNPPRLEIIRLLVEANFYSVLQKDQRGRTPYQQALNNYSMTIEVETYLLE